MAESTKGCGCCDECTGEHDCDCGCSDCTCCSEAVCDCGCDCCDTDDKFTFTAVSSIVGMFIMGILVLLSGIYCLNLAFNFVSLGTFAGVDAVKTILSVVIVVISLVSFRVGDITQGMFLLLFGLWGILVSESSMLSGTFAPMYVGLIVALAFFVVAAILISGKDLMYGACALLVAVGFVINSILIVVGGSTFCGVSGIMFIIAAVLLIYISISDWVYIETGRSLPVI